MMYSKEKDHLYSYIFTLCLYCCISPVRYSSFTIQFRCKSINLQNKYMPTKLPTLSAQTLPPLNPSKSCTNTVNNGTLSRREEKRPLSMQAFIKGKFKPLFDKL